MLTAVTPLACDYLQLSNTLQTCIVVWAKRRLPFKVYLINVLRLKVITRKTGLIPPPPPEKLAAAYVGGDKCV